MGFRVAGLRISIGEGSGSSGAGTWTWLGLIDRKVKPLLMAVSCVSAASHAAVLMAVSCVSASSHELFPLSKLLFIILI